MVGLFQERLYKIVLATQDCGWGFHDSLAETYFEIKSIFDPQRTFIGIQRASSSYCERTVSFCNDRAYAALNIPSRFSSEGC